jgi:hypothetical protein
MKLTRGFFAVVCAALAALGSTPARAAGTTPLALNVQFDLQGALMPGCLLYFYVAGTVATPQQVFQDLGLTNQASNPLRCDAGARVPQHYLADGPIHLRLTDASGVVVVDSTIQVLGPSSGGGGGGGGAVDPTAVAATGDIKTRLSAEVLVGWVTLNGTTIGSASSGASQRANADTQNLFVYLWQNCSDHHCAVLGGRGSSAIADFNANKQITLPDMRAKNFVGRDCMGASCANILLAANITSGGGDGPDTVGGGGGQPNQTASTTLTAANVPAITYSVDIPSQWTHSHSASAGSLYGNSGTPAGNLLASSGNVAIFGDTLTSAVQPDLTGTATCGGCVGSTAISAPFSDLGPFLLSTWYIKL